jgi:hypothetical protein
VFTSSVIPRTQIVADDRRSELGITKSIHPYDAGVRTGEGAEGQYVHRASSEGIRFDYVATRAHSFNTSSGTDRPWGSVSFAAGGRIGFGGGAMVSRSESGRISAGEIRESMQRTG